MMMVMMMMMMCKVKLGWLVYVVFAKRGVLGFWLIGMESVACWGTYSTTNTIEEIILVLLKYIPAVWGNLFLIPTWRNQALE